MHADCTIPELPQLGCLVPSATPTAAPSASPTPMPTFSQEPVPTLTAAPTPVDVAPVVPVLPVVEQPAATAAPPPPALVAPSPTPSSTTTAVPVASGMPLASVVPSAYAIVAFGVIGVALLVSFLSGLKPSGGTMKATRTRLWAGLATIAAAAVVGGVGWYRISGEPLLNRQIPFLASAGIAVVVLAVLGGALVVAEQLRADQNRIGDLEDAVRALTEALAPTVENPARRA